MTQHRPRPNINMQNALLAEVTDLRQLADLLAEALRLGGLDRQWEAMKRYEAVRGIAYFAPTEGGVVRRTKRVKGFNCEPFQSKESKPYDQDEEQQ